MEITLIALGIIFSLLLSGICLYKSYKLKGEVDANKASLFKGASFGLLCFPEVGLVHFLLLCNPSLDNELVLFILATVMCLSVYFLFSKLFSRKFKMER